MYVGRARQMKMGVLEVDLSGTLENPNFKNAPAHT